MKKTLSQLNFILSKENKKYLLSILILSVFVSLIESIGISGIMPFMSLAMDEKVVYSNEKIHFLFQLFNFQTPKSFIYFFGFSLMVFYLIRGMLNVFYFYSLSKITEKLNDSISIKIFNRYMLTSYESFIKKNSAEITKLISFDVFYMTSCLQSTLFILSEVLIVIFIYVIMLYVNYKITLSLSVLFGVLAVFFVAFFSKKVKEKGVERINLQKYFYEVLSSTLGNFKIIKLQSHNENVLKKFSEARISFGEISVFSNFIGQFPRILLETISFILIISTTIGIIWFFSENITNFLPTISIFLLGLFRLMPSVNRILNNYNNIIFQTKSIESVYLNLQEEYEILGDDKINFEKEIRLNNVAFSYNENKKVLENINLTITKGDKIAFTGKSGGGKSTLVDIISGLLKAKAGNITVDQVPLTTQNLKEFRKKIGYIPQSVYLFDGTVAENVAFENTYSETQVISALKNARLYDFLLSCPEGIHTKVGEGGVSLSGGQKQRVAIARALYSDPEILVLDEATSALDNETETEIMNEIYDLSQNKTLLVIAHRLSTISKCNKVYNLIDGKLNLVPNA